MTTRRDFTKAMALSPLLASPVSRVLAQAPYPSKLIQIVVGFPPGQASDIGARILAKAMSDELKQAVYVDNKPGAAGIIAHQYLKAAPPDGYTIAFSSTASLAIVPTLHKKPPYDPQKDFDPIIMMSSSAFFLYTGKDTKVNSYKDMLDYVKKTKDVNYGSGGSGATNHITMELLKKQAGIEMLHVPYKGAVPLMTDVMANRVQFAFEVPGAILPMAKSGQITLLGVASMERSPAAPDIPTLHEQGLTNFESGVWGVLLAPKGTPKDVIARLNAAANAAAKSKEMSAYYANAGAITTGGTPEFCYEFMKRERERWAPVILASGAQID